MPISIDTCIVCEGAREEVGRKFTLLGVYGAAPHARVLVRDLNLPVGLCFAFMGGQSDAGHYTLDFQIMSPDGRVFPGGGIEGNFQPGMPATGLFLFFAGVLPGPGEYRARLLTRGPDQALVYEAHFHLGEVPHHGFAALPQPPVFRQ